jgi:hypothetical protein
VLNLMPVDGAVTELRVPPSKRAIVSWNATQPIDTLELIVDTAAGHRSRALPYVVFETGARASLNGFDNVAKIETDVVSAPDDIVAIHVTSHHPLARVAASTPPDDTPRTTNAPRADAVRELEVPQRSQYDAAFPGVRGWCAPASLAMLLGANGITVSLADVVAGVFDRSYNGTGNWTFAIAYAASRGLAGAAAYLRDLVTAETFIAAGIPIAVSISWSGDALPGAPIAQSDGHIVVIRGFAANGDVIVNDPAQPLVRHVYDRAAFARCWLDHGGVALLAAPPDRIDDLVRCANA